MDETIYVILKVQFDFVLEVWFSIFLNGPGLKFMLNSTEHEISAANER